MASLSINTSDLVKLLALIETHTRTGSVKGPQEEKKGEKKAEGRETKEEQTKGTARKVASLKTMDITFADLNSVIRTDYQIMSKTRFKDHVKNTHEMIFLAMKGAKGPAIGMGFGLIEPAELILKQFGKLKLVDADALNLKAVVKSISKEQRSNIERQVADLTNGLFVRFEKFVQALVEKKNQGRLDEKEFRAEIRKEFQAVVASAPRFGFEKLVTGDHSQGLVVASLVMTQLSDQINTYILKGYEACFGEGTENDLLQHPDYSPSLIAFRNFINVSFLVEVHQILKPDGMFYFSDTTDRYIGKEYEGNVIPSRFDACIKGLFKTAVERTWTWQMGTLHAYTVKAYVLQPKPMTQEEMLRLSAKMLRLLA